MDDKTDKMEMSEPDKTEPNKTEHDETEPDNDSTTLYNTEPDKTMPYSRMGDSTIQDTVDKGKADKGNKGNKGKLPARPKGPNASAIIVGLLAMILAGLVIAKESMGFHVDWSRLGPGAIVGLGVVMLLIGAIGLIRRQDNDV